MKRILSVLLTGFALTACGEQLQATYTGQAQIDENTCTNRFATYDVSVRTRISGSSIDFKILDFQPAQNGSQSIQQQQALTTTGRYFRALNLFADLIDDNRIEGRDPFYEVTQIDPELAKLIEDGDLSREEIEEVTYDIIEIYGEMNAARDVISSFQVERSTTIVEKGSGDVRDCTISFFAPELIIE